MSITSGAPDFLPNVRPQADFDVLFDSAVTLPGSFTETIAHLDGIYQSALVLFTGSAVTCVATTTVTNPTIGDGGERAVTLQTQPTGGVLALVPFYNRPKDSMTIAITTSLSVSGTLQVIGFRTPVDPHLRPDGRLKAQHSNVVRYHGTAPGTLLASPGVSNRILVGSLNISAGFTSAGQGSAAFNFNIQGVSVDFLLSNSSTDFVQADRWESDEGLLLDENTGILIAAGGTFATQINAFATYDVVS